eukprot:GEMP01028546.1.p1 GENE.GEMP01028546.1~~GEMP01028546.1.p1  ORF type:complete len:656 (+),score=127.26 GEMP01028546.1:54-2021(+)
MEQFIDEWLPHPSKIQPFWFGAKKPSYRKLFESYRDQYETQLFALMTSAVGSPGMFWFRCAYLPPKRIARLAIWMDQMGRNLEAVDSPLLRPFLDMIAPAILLTVLPLLRDLTLSEWCFASLVFRHTRRKEDIRRSLEMLGGVDCSNDGEEAKDIIRKFKDESTDALLRVDVSAYIARAMSSDRPTLFAARPVENNLRVLDERCLGYQDSFLHFATIPGFADSEDLESHPVTKELEAVLREEELLNSTILLSLSGGVDSMVHLCCLWFLKRSGKFAGPVGALHLRHSNRSDAMDEENWVARLCHALNIPLYTYWVELQRPHGDKRTGISREDYESVTRDIRYRMYIEAFNMLEATASSGSRRVVMVGHHEDDRDENRLSELGKGTLIRIDGMTRWHSQSGVDLLRPLLHVRKQKLFDLASQLHLFYMQDSTPKWSRRGWIRRVLDAESRLAPHRKSLIPRLKALGGASDAFGTALDAKLKAWKAIGVSTFAHNGMPVASFDVGSLIDFEMAFRDEFCAIVHQVADIAKDWNPLFQAYAAEHPDFSCPIQRIPSNSPELGPFLFSRSFYATQLDTLGEELLEGVIVGRRALNHCWSCMLRCRQEILHGHLHQTIPYVYVRADKMLFFTGPSGQEALEKGSSAYLSFPRPLNGHATE